jgi:catechol 2,3-dioxygenase-like lactoylglutathione lyase family enzyme
MIGNTEVIQETGVPEIPVSNVEKAAEYYVNVLGFSFDWAMTRAGLGAFLRGLAGCS